MKLEQIFESLLQKLRGESALNSLSSMSGDNLYFLVFDSPNEWGAQNLMLYHTSCNSVAGEFDCPEQEVLPQTIFPRMKRV